MTEHEKRASERVPVALRIRLRYHAVDQFISKFAVNISRGGMFLSSRNPKAPGTELYFEIRLADESPVIEGSGQVRWIREYDRRRPDEPHGMGIEFLEISEESWPVLERIIEHRRHIGEHDHDSIPEPKPFDRSARPSEPAYDPRDGRTTGDWPEASDPGLLRSTPPSVSIPDDRPAGKNGSDRRVEPAPGDRPDTDEDLRRELMRVLAPAVLLTSRQQEAAAPPIDADPPGGPGDDAPGGTSPAVDAPAPLDGESPHGLDVRPAQSGGESRPASAPRRAESTRPLPLRGDEPPVVRAAVARARALTGGVQAEAELDRELAELLEESAVPIEITVEAASRELAERLGGAPVERRRPGRDRNPSRPPTTRAMSLDEALTDDLEPDEPHARAMTEPLPGDSHAARLLRGKS